MITKQNSDKEHKDYYFNDNAEKDDDYKNNKILGSAWYFSNRENHRYYSLMIQRDLFGTIIVTRMWGSKMRKGSRIAHMPFSTKSQALEYVDNIRKVRAKRGYELVVSDCR